MDQNRDHAPFNLKPNVSVEMSNYMNPSTAYNPYILYCIYLFAGHLWLTILDV